jgi:hypothetical protein
MGLQHDVMDCAAIDSLPVMPEFDARSGVLTSAV